MYGLKEDSDQVVLTMAVPDVIAFRYFLRNVVYTNTSGERRDMAQHWVPFADSLLAQAGYRCVKGDVLPIASKETE
jgi:hypothetical protein